MNRKLGLVFLVIGGILLGYGIDTAHAISSDIFTVSSNAPVDKSLLLLAIGVLFLVLGVESFWSMFKSHR